jgi:hypothetical protein
MRVRTIEKDERSSFLFGSGWIARNPYTGEEIWPGFRWASRSVARAVVAECRMMTRRPPGRGVRDGRR